MLTSERDKIEKARNSLVAIRTKCKNIQEYIEWLETSIIIFYVTDEGNKELLEITNTANSRMPGFIEVVKNMDSITAMAERGRPFDKTKYDRSIFKAAMIRYKLATGYDKYYGRCLLAELKQRGIADDKYKESTEFRYWEIAFRQYRHEEHLVKKKGKKLGRANKRS